MNLIDTHTHIYDTAFDADREDVISSALAAGVTTMLLPNVDETSVQPMLDLQKTLPDVFCVMMGLHPTEVGPDYKKTLSNIEKHLGQDSCVAVGEIGLDFYWDTTFAKQQEDAFLTQLQWAKSLHLPVSIHTRNAFDRLFEILEREQDGTLNGVLHCFNGSLEQAEHGIRLGFCLGIGGMLTYKNCRLQDFVAQLPLEKMVLETDAPYLSPVPCRGKRNEPAFMLHTAQRLAELTSVDFETIAATTSKTAKQLFKITGQTH